MENKTTSNCATEAKEKGWRAVVKFIRDWVLPLAIATGSAIYFLFAYTPGLEKAADFCAPICDTILPMFMFLVLFVTFCKIDFKKLRPVTWHWWVSGFQVLSVVMISGVILAFQLSGNSLILMEALLVCIIGPAASAAAVVTAKLGGSLEEMTTYTFLSNILTAVLVPVCFPFIEPSLHFSFLQAFALILYKVCAILIVPMVLAYIVKHFMHRFHRWVTGVKDLSYYLWAGSLLIVSGTTMKNIMHAGTTVSFLCVIAVFSMVLCIVQFAVGRFIGHYFGATVNAGQALGQKNTVFAIWIAIQYLNPLSSVGAGCYVLWQNIINSVELWMYGKRGELHSA